MYLQIRFACGVTFHQKSLERAGVTERFLIFLCLAFWMLHFLNDLFDWKSVNHQQQCFQDLEWSLMALWRVSMVTKTLPLWPLLPSKPVTGCRFFYLPLFWFLVTIKNTNLCFSNAMWRHSSDNVESVVNTLICTDLQQRRTNFCLDSGQTWCWIDTIALKLLLVFSRHA